MIKSATITLHDTDNCGSSLQTFALQQFLLRNNIDNEVINYVPSYTINNGHPLKAIFRWVVLGYYKKRNRKKFIEFRNEYLDLTKKTYRSYRQLVLEPPEADVYITGSDQLWNSMYLCGEDPAFYLDFIKDKRKKKIAYAVSAARNPIPEDNMKIIHRYISNFIWISMREKESVQQIKKTLEEVPISYVADPVLLNNIEIYDKVASGRLIKEKYILVYVAQKINKSLLNETISYIKRYYKEMQVIFIGSYIKRCNCDKHIRAYGPSDFISLIKNAEFILCNSFHCTVLSVLYEKQFYAIIPSQNGLRIEGFLDTVGLRSRGFNSICDVCWETITNSKLSEAKEIALEFGKKSGQKLLNFIS